MSRRGKRKPREVFQGDGPTPEQMAKLGIERRFVTHAESATKSMAHISSHSPVERWERAGRLSDTQLSAITLVRALWERCGLRQKITATYGERLPLSASNEWIAVHEIQAMRDLTRIERYVRPVWAFEVFENVCRWDEPAGVAGAALGFNGTTGAQAATLMLVRMVADQIAKEERL